MLTSTKKKFLSSFIWKELIKVGQITRHVQRPPKTNQDGTDQGLKLGVRKGSGKGQEKRNEIYTHMQIQAFRS